MGFSAFVVRGGDTLRGGVHVSEARAVGDVKFIETEIAGVLVVELEDTATRGDFSPEPGTPTNFMRGG